MRAGLWGAKLLVKVLGELIGDRTLERLCLLVRFVPWIAEHTDHIAHGSLNQAYIAHQPDKPIWLSKEAA